MKYNVVRPLLDGKSLPHALVQSNVHSTVVLAPNTCAPFTEGSAMQARAEPTLQLRRLRVQYNRVLAVMWDDAANVNLLMVGMGDAEVYRGAPCVVQCKVPGTVAWANPKTPRVPSRSFPTGGDEACLLG